MNDCYLIFEKDKIIEVIDSKDNRMITNKLGLKNNLLLGCKLIDSNGRVKKIISVEKGRNVNSILKFEFFNPMIYVKFRLSETKKEFTIDKIKTMLKNSFNSKTGIWDSMVGFEDLEKDIDSAQNIKEIFDLLCEKIF